MIKVPDDRVVQGFVSGVLASIPMIILDTISGYLGFDEVPHRNWAASLVLGYTPNTVFEKFLGHMGHLLFAGILGVLFSYFIYFTGSRVYLFKGLFFSLVVWFSVHVTVSLFGFKPLLIIPPMTVASDVVTAIVYGLVLALVFERLRDEADTP